MTSTEGEYEFELTVTRRRPNPDYEEPRRGQYQDGGVPRFVEERVLFVVLRPAEFDAVRFALVGTIFTEGKP